MDEQTIPLFMPGREYPVREGANYTAKPVNHLSGVFRGPLLFSPNVLLSFRFLELWRFATPSR